MLAAFSHKHRLGARVFQGKNLKITLALITILFLFYELPYLVTFSDGSTHPFGIGKAETYKFDDDYEDDPAMDIVRPTDSPAVVNVVAPKVTTKGNPLKPVPTGNIQAEDSTQGSVKESSEDSLKGSIISDKSLLDTYKSLPAKQTEDMKEYATKYWKSVFDVFNKAKFKEEDKPIIEEVDQANQYKPKEKTRKSLLSKSKIKDLDLVKISHRKVYNQLSDELPTTVYNPGSKGIVTIGGGFYSWLAAIQVLQLRKIGSMLPIEVVIPTFKDYEREAEFCKEFLPKHNAKCIIVEEAFGKDIVTQIGSYQFKAAGLAISSFQHTLLLDSDNNPVMAPDRFFEAKVYKTNGMVLWPDYWPRTMSPEWHDIIGKPYSLTEKVRDGRFPLVNVQHLAPEQEEKTKFTELKGTLSDLSTESGQVMINKGTHGKVVLMILYYNMFGPELYYKLFSLGALGEGDKDTFATAAFACGKQYYQVKSYIKTFGYHDDGYNGMTMAQKDPEEDYQLFMRLEKEYRDKGIDWDKDAKEAFGGDNDVPVFTLHCNIKKINPFEYIKDDKISDLSANRLKQRFYSKFKMRLPEDGIDGVSTVKEIDFELSRWESVEELLCEKKIKFTITKEKDIESVCEYIKNTIAWLKVKK